MSSIHSVQNFSLPSRSGSRRVATPMPLRSLGSLGTLRTPLTSDTAADGQRVRSPSPVALRHFRFAYSEVPGEGPRPRPRPMSTSSSAPVLTLSAATAAAAAAADMSNAAAQPTANMCACQSRDENKAENERDDENKENEDPRCTGGTESNQGGNDPDERDRNRSGHSGNDEDNKGSEHDSCPLPDTGGETARRHRYRLALWLFVVTLFAAALSSTASLTLFSAGWKNRQGAAIAWLVASLLAGMLLAGSLAVLTWRWVKIQRQARGNRGGKEADEEGEPTGGYWIEMAELAGGSPRPRPHASGIVKANKADEENTTTPAIGADATTDAAREEDRNWARFAEDPARLRRYVEALEGRLAAVGGEEGGMGGEVAVERARRAELARLGLGRAITTSSNSSVSHHSHDSHDGSTRAASPVVGGLAPSTFDASSSSLLLPPPLRQLDLPPLPMSR